VRGDVFQLKTPRDARGHEQRGNRYAVVVQSDLLPLSTWLVAPTSTGARPTSFRPAIEIDGKSTLVLAEQTAAIDPERLGHLVGHLTQREMSAVDDALRVVLHLMT
jgi:mRNA interferase MazF